MKNLYPTNETRSRLGGLGLSAFALTCITLGAPVLSLGGQVAGFFVGEISGETVKLDDLMVTAERVESKNYKVQDSITATKTDTPLIDVPQSITVVTEQQIKDQQMLSLGDVVRYVPGITAHQGENNRDQIVFRGNSSSADFFINGVRDDVQYYRDLYNLSRVEVLRGPNAMIFGRGGGGGLINRVTKVAEFRPLQEVTLQVGSFDQKRATVDVNQPVNDKVAVRLNAFYEDSESFRNFVELNRWAVNPTLTFAATDATKFTLSYEHLRDTRIADRGITSFHGLPADVPIETYYGNPNDAYVRATADFLTGTIEHQVGGLTIRNRTLYADYDRSYQNYVPGAVNATQMQVTLTAYNNATQRQNLFNQTDLTYTATTGAVRQTLLGGVELGAQQTDNFRNTGYFNNTTTSILVPYDQPTISTPPVTFRQSATDADNHIDTDLAAIYAQDQVEFSRNWQAVLGLRFDSFDLKYHNNRNGDSLSRRDNLVSPRAGLIYKPVAQASLYANYSVSYLPSSGDQFSSLTVITQQVKPEKFTNYELGAKWDVSSHFSATTAVYQLDRTNTRSTDPTDPTRIVQTGSTRTTGFEIGLSGSVTKDWSVSGGYAYQDAYIRRATTAAPAGATVPQVPRHSFSLWNRYQMTPQFGAGLGIIYRSDMFAAIDNTVVVPGYTRVDAAVYYTINKHWHAQANVENLLDRKYYINSDSNTNISPGSPLAFRVMVRATF
ncbi:MAG TPA: TonB-dependent siderophore receptor [Candidatus Didemnitutus sp.]|nr:TonB-dependent siderophore receptor [Candidatus Didemnitutus sp.]